MCVCFVGVYEGNTSLKIKNLKTKLCTRDWDLQLKERPNDFEKVLKKMFDLNVML